MMDFFEYGKRMRKPKPFYEINDEQLERWESAVPTELKNYTQWVVWRYERQDEKQKWGKIPYDSKDNNPRKASVSDCNTWNEFEPTLFICEVKKFDGIGFVLRADNKLFGIDLDNCRNRESGVIDSWAWGIIQRIDSYVEISPSGTGIRIFAAGQLPEQIAAPVTGRKNETTEIYWRGRYVTVTGHVVSGYEKIQERSSEILKWFNETFPEPKPAVRPAKNTHPNLSDEKILEIAFRAKNGQKIQSLYNGDTSAYKGDDSKADLALVKALAFYTQDEKQLDRLFRSSGLYRPKWERDGYREDTIRKAIASCTDTYRPNSKRDMKPFF